MYIDPRIAYQFEQDGREHSLPVEGFKHPDTFSPEEREWAETFTLGTVDVCKGSGTGLVSDGYSLARALLLMNRITQYQYLEIAEAARERLMGDDYQPLQYPDRGFYFRMGGFLNLREPHLPVAD